PILAGPGAMMAVLVTSSAPERGPMIAALAAVIVLGVTWFLLHFIDRVYRLLGRTTCTVLSKILCLFIAAIGVRLLMKGLSHYFPGG
ncbi:MAG: MarC family protein, partial [Planctomycetota bacterium]